MYNGVALTRSAQFVHSPKVKAAPVIDDHDYRWQGVTGLPKDEALDNAESYAILALGKHQKRKESGHTIRESQVDKKN